MTRLKIISTKKLDTDADNHSVIHTNTMSSGNLHASIKNHLTNIIDKELARKIILNHAYADGDIAVTNNINCILDICVDITYRLRITHIELYDLAITGSSVTSMVFVYLPHDKTPAGILIARVGRHDYMFSSVLLNTAKEICNSLRSSE